MASFKQTLVESKPAPPSRQARASSPWLAPAGFAYGLAVRAWDFLYGSGFLARHRLGRPTVSVGNLTWGGTGKTPFLRFLASRLRARGRRALLLTRGYATDELAEMSRWPEELLIVQGRDRWRSVRPHLAESTWDVALLDDGFQHRALARDLDVVLVSALDPFGNGRLIPCGTLREPLTALARADVVVITHSDLVEEATLEVLRCQLRALAPGAPLLEARHAPAALRSIMDESSQAPGSLEGKPVVAFCAIASPQSFRRTLERLGARVERLMAWRDHAPLTARREREIEAAVREVKPWALVTTEKDERRGLPSRLIELGLRVLDIRLEILHGQDDLDHRLDRLLAR